MFEACDAERQAEFKAYWEKRLGPKLSGFTDSSLCLTPEEENTLQIGEDPNSKIEARTLKISFEYCSERDQSDIDQSGITCKSKEETDDWLDKADVGF